MLLNMSHWMERPRLLLSHIDIFWNPLIGSGANVNSSRHPLIEKWSPNKVKMNKKCINVLCRLGIVGLDVI